MNKQAAIDYFGSVAALASAIDATPSAISQWGDYPPGGRQLQLEAITKGKLKAEPNCMKKERAAKEGA